MVTMRSDRRSREYLESILYETATWTLTGVQGVVLCEVASLRVAIGKAAEFDAAGREVVALVRRHPAEIVVFAGQLRNLDNYLPDYQAFRDARVMADGVPSVPLPDITINREAV